MNDPSTALQVRQGRGASLLGPDTSVLGMVRHHSADSADNTVRSRSVASAEEAARVRLAAMADTPADVLEELARDPTLMVRAAVAMNPAAPSRAEAMLAADPDERIRIMLGRKLAALMPSLGGPDRERLQEAALSTLNALAQDEAVRVRAAIAAVLREMPEAPHALILRLASDEAVSVLEPVIRLSPLLSAADLLGLLARPRSPATATAVARRPGLDETVSDAIAASSDDGAICALLENGSAAIRESTLDALIARAADRETWHEPLVRRPGLTDKAAHALSGIVATHLLGILSERVDLDPAIKSSLQRRLSQRLDGASVARNAEFTLDEAVADARVLFEEGLLTEAKLLEAAGEGRTSVAQAMLAVAANVPAVAVDRVVTLRNSKALVSLTWQAGFSMACAVTLQTLLARVAPAQVIRPTASGGYPLSAAEMKYQLEIISRRGR